MKRRASFVVGVDGSATGAAAVAWATEHLGPQGVLHVVHARPSPGLFSFGRSDDPETEQAARQALESDWTAAAREHGSTVHTHLVESDPSDALLEVAESHQADAIIVGAHGSGDSRLVLGSVTTKLLHGSDVPVVVINPNQSVVGEAAGMVVACVGYGVASDRAAEWAADYASLHQVRLQLVHVIEPRPIFPNDSPTDTIAAYFGPELARDWAQSDLDALQRELHEYFPDLDITTKLHSGRQIRSLEDATQGAAMVVLGKRRTNMINKRLIGHKLHQLVVRITSPVAVVPTCAPDE